MEPNQIIDIGINLTNKRFRNDVDAVIERAINAGVAPMVLTGTSAQGSEDAIQLAKRFPQMLYATAGVHPHDAKSWTATTRERIITLLDNKQVIAVGECGLDFNRNFSSKADQLRCFEDQLMIAVDHNKPVFLHERDAHEAFIEILANYKSQLPAAVVHCFTGNRQELEAYLELDCYIGITGWVCDKKRGEELRTLIPYILSDRLLIETDAPFLTPHNLPFKPDAGRNEPAFLPYVLQKISEILQQPYEILAQQTTKNAKRFFNI